MRQRRWLELIKDYELEVYYHSGKANIVVDALSRQVRCNNLKLQEGNDSDDISVVTFAFQNLKMFNFCCYLNKL